MFWDSVFLSLLDTELGAMRRIGANFIVIIILN